MKIVFITTRLLLLVLIERIFITRTTFYLVFCTTITGY